MDPDGRHLAFPFHVGADGRTVNPASLDEHVKQEVIQLLLTNPGERAFLPEFGGGARRLVFEGITDTTESMTKAMVSQAIGRWLAERVALESLEVTVKDTTITIDIAYRIAGTADQRTLRFERKGG